MILVREILYSISSCCFQVHIDVNVKFIFYEMLLLLVCDSVLFLGHGVKVLKKGTITASKIRVYEFVFQS